MRYKTVCEILSTCTERYRTAELLAFPYGLVVRIPAFHAGGPGSIPGVGANCFIYLPTLIQCLVTTKPGSGGARTRGLSRVKRA